MTTYSIRFYTPTTTKYVNSKTAHFYTHNDFDDFCELLDAATFYTSTVRLYHEAHIYDNSTGEVMFIITDGVITYHSPSFSD